MVSQNMSSRIK